MNISLPKKMMSALALFGCVSMALAPNHLSATEIGTELTELTELTEVAAGAGAEVVAAIGTEAQETLEQLQDQLDKIELKIAQNAELELEKKATIAEIEQAFKDKSLEIQSKDEQIAMLEQQLKELEQEDTQ